MGRFPALLHEVVVGGGLEGGGWPLGRAMTEAAKAKRESADVNCMLMVG